MAGAANRSGFGQAAKVESVWTANDILAVRFRQTIKKNFELGEPLVGIKMSETIWIMWRLVTWKLIGVFICTKSLSLQQLLHF